jgi:hypothetical protein
MHMVNVDRNKAIRIYVTFDMFDILDYIFSLIFNFLQFFLWNPHGFPSCNTSNRPHNLNFIRDLLWEIYCWLTFFQAYVHAVLLAVCASYSSTRSRVWSFWRSLVHLLWPHHWLCEEMVAPKFFVLTDSKLEPQFFQFFSLLTIRTSKTLHTSNLFDAKGSNSNCGSNTNQLWGPRHFPAHIKFIVISTWPLCCGNACKL